MGTNLHCLIYNCANFHVFSLSVNSKKILVEDTLNTKGLVTLTEYQQMGWRLIKVGNWDNKNYKRYIAEPDFTF